MKDSIKNREKTQTNSGEKSQKDGNQVTNETVYVLDGSEGDTEIRTVCQSVAAFGGVGINRFFLRRGGSEKEIVKCFDCPLHFVARNYNENYCVLPVGEFDIDPRFLKPVGQMQVCTHVCAFKKAQYRKWMDYIEQWGRSIPEEEVRRMTEYLSAPFTRHGDDFVLPDEEEMMP